jgi:hypothetical protein
VSRWLGFFGVLALAALVGCGPAASGNGASEPASSGLRRLIATLRGDDPRPAYDMLAADARKDISFDDFATRWKETGAERELQARALEEGLKGNPSLGERARVEYRDGKTVYLVREKRGWRLESALVTPFHAARPHDAVRVFAEALAGRDYEGVLRVLTGRRREAIRGQVDDFVTALLANLDGEINMLGKDSAELHFQGAGKRYRVVLIREGDEWRIDDIHVRAAPVDKDKPKLDLRDDGDDDDDDDDE